MLYSDLEYNIEQQEQYEKQSKKFKRSNFGSEYHINYLALQQREKYVRSAKKRGWNSIDSGKFIFLMRDSKHAYLPGVCS